MGTIRVYNDYESDDDGWDDKDRDDEDAWNLLLPIYQHNLLDWEWNKIIDKLQNGRLRLTTQEENIIAQIANRL